LIGSRARQVRREREPINQAEAEMTLDAAVSDLLLEWEQSEALGRPVSPEELCRSRPELLAEVRRCIDLLRFVSPLLDLDGTTPGSPAVPTVPGFEVLDYLGGGGMGVVYRARDTTLDRVVALKMPHRGMLTGEVARSRFEREARVLAQLRHPNIVPVHAAGLADGQPYFVMDYLPPGSLAGQSARLVGRVEAVTDIVEKVARAVEYAHQRGVFHRDLKPSNILLDEHGQPLVADFGVAALLDPDGEAGEPAASATAPADGAGQTPRLTRTGVTVGTPAYMAPEQFAAGSGASAAADVWALGVVFYQLLTGRLPFAAADPAQLEGAIREADPPRPSAVRASLPRDRRLDAIVLRCLAKAPADRYASAGALAEDLARWRRGVQARKRRGRLTAVALAVTAAVAAVLFFARPEGRSQPQPPTPAEIEQRAEEEYRQAVAPLPRELAEGRTVSLIGPETRSLPSRWRAGQGRVRFHDHAQEGRSVSVSSNSTSLLELLPDPGAAGYRLVVELRQENLRRGGHNPEAAVAFACSQHFTADGSNSFFGRVRFADLGAGAAVFRDPAGRPACLFQLGYFCLAASGEGYDKPVSYGVSSLFYPPDRIDTPPGPWRRIELEVRADRVRARHGEGEAVKLVPGVEGPNALAFFQRRVPTLRGIEARLADRGAVGLYVDGCVVSLRRFDVEPLGEGE
jgi:serine/threonine-protein kinase